LPANVAPKRARAEPLQHRVQAQRDLVGKVRVLEQVTQQRVVVADRLEVLVLVVREVAQPVVAQELLHHVRAQVVRLGDAHRDLRGGRIGLLGLLQDLPAQQHARGLAPHQARAVIVGHDAVHQVVEVADPQVLLGEALELQLLGDEAPDQRQPNGDRLPLRQRGLAHGQPAELPHLLCQHRMRYLGQARDLLQGQRLLPLSRQVDQILDLVPRELPGGVLQGHPLDVAPLLLIPAMRHLHVVRLGDLHLHRGQLGTLAGLAGDLVQRGQAAAVQRDQQRLTDTLLHRRVPRQQLLDEGPIGALTHGAPSPAAGPRP